jgi:hypothetical protein
MVSRGFQQEPDSEGVRRTKWAAVRNTYKQLTDTTAETVFYWLPPFYFGDWKVTDHKYTINKFAPLPDGTRVEIEIKFRALDKEEHVRNLLSLELTGAWLNEVREIPKVIVDAVEGRCRRFPAVNSDGTGGPTWTGVIADSNPPDVDSWIYKLFEERIKSDPSLAARYAIFKQPSGRSKEAENIKFLRGGRAYYTDLAIGKDPEFVKVYCDGEYGYIRDGKPVYGNYTDTLHLADERILPVRGIPIIVGMDFALNPAAAICQLLPNGKFNVIDEIIGADIGLRRFMSDQLKPYFANNLRGYEVIIAGDPAGVRRGDTDERSCFDELKMSGFPAVPARSNSFLARFNAVDAFLTKLVDKRGALQLSPSCGILRTGFLGEYKLKKVIGFRNDMHSEVPVKNMYSHVQDALQYAAMVVDHAAQVSRSYQHMGSRYDDRYQSPVNMTAWT